MSLGQTQASLPRYCHRHRHYYPQRHHRTATITSTAMAVPMEATQFYFLGTILRPVCVMVLEYEYTAALVIIGERNCHDAYVGLGARAVTRGLGSEFPRGCTAIKGPSSCECREGIWQRFKLVFLVDRPVVFKFPTKLKVAPNTERDTKLNGRSGRIETDGRNSRIRDPDYETTTPWLLYTV